MDSDETPSLEQPHARDSLSLDEHGGVWTPGASESAQHRPHTLTELHIDNMKNNISKQLTERHIGIVAVAGMLGTGLFLTSGRSLADAGPGGALLGYFLVRPSLSRGQLHLT